MTVISPVSRADVSCQCVGHAVAANSLQRAFEVFDLLAHKPNGLTNAEICRRLRMATSSGSYLLQRLERERFLLRDHETRRYRIGLRILEIAHGAFRALRLRRVAEPMLHMLAVRTSLTSFIGIRERDGVLIVARAGGCEQTKPDLDLGCRLPLHATALGKVALAGLPRSGWKATISALQLARCTSKTIQSPDALLEEIELVRQQGYAKAEEEIYLGWRAVAAPIVNAYGTICAGLSIAGPIEASSWQEPQRMIAQTKAAARDISHAMAERGRFAVTRRPFPTEDRWAAAVTMTGGAKP